MKFEIEKCSDLNCKYAYSELVCPEDSFDEDVIAYCKHPDAPERNGLGCDDNPDYMKIPEWCPRRLKDPASQDATEAETTINSRLKDVLNTAEDDVVLTDYLYSSILNLFSMQYTKAEISHALHHIVDTWVNKVSDELNKD